MKTTKQDRMTAIEPPPTTHEASTHTSGPWEVSSSVIVVSNNADKLRIICSTASFDALQEHAPTMSEAIANARLIAAAPELLAILQRFYAATYGNTDLIPQLDFEQARAVIAKAEGQS